MRLHVLGSGSKANGYVLYNDNEALLIECGCPLSSCLKVLDFNRKNIVGALVSHEHTDHAKYVKQYLDSAINIYASNGTCERLGIKSSPYANCIKDKESVSIGNFKVLAFHTQHDCEEPLGFLIYHSETGSVLFATDTYYVKYKFGNLSQIMIECNYDSGIINENVKSGVIPVCVRDRVYRAHMSLNTAILTLKANDISKVQNVVLMHLSSNNANPSDFKKAVEESIGKRVTVAQSGVDIPFNKDF